jgi:hypothetical protein
MNCRPLCVLFKKQFTFGSDFFTSGGHYFSFSKNLKAKTQAAAATREEQRWRREASNLKLWPIKLHVNSSY